MCARFTLRSDSYGLASLFGLDEAPDLEPRYNIAPTQDVAAVIETPEHVRRIEMFRWGLVPSWAKDETIGPRLINARAETAAEKPSFRAALKRRRCLIAADGFFEWREEGGHKQPYLFERKDGKPFGMAGLWEVWHHPDDGDVRSCTILTTDANGAVRPYHDRMPVILDPKDFDLWLDPEFDRTDVLSALLKPTSDDLLQAHPVDRRMGNPRFDGPEAVARAAP